MKIVLIEDDKIHCQKYKNCIEYLPYSIQLDIAHGSQQGIELIQCMKPDVILLDLELQKTDGDGILLLNSLKKIKLTQIPYIIVITVNCSPRVHKTARRCGMDYIFIKSKPDYSPRMVLDFAHTYFINAEDESIKNSQNVAENTFESEIAKEIEKIGITYGMNGRDYIIDAVSIILNLYENNFAAASISLNRHVYPVIARKYKKSEKSIEQGIRNAIKKAWLITDLDILADSYTAVVSYRTGFPENRDFLFYYADKLKGAAGHG